MRRVSLELVVLLAVGKLLEDGEALPEPGLVKGSGRQAHSGVSDPAKTERGGVVRQPGARVVAHGRMHAALRLVNGNGTSSTAHKGICTLRRARGNGPSRTVRPRN